MRSPLNRTVPFSSRLAFVVVLTVWAALPVDAKEFKIPLSGQIAGTSWTRVARASGSTQYGSDSLGGTINFSSRSEKGAASFTIHGHFAAPQGRFSDNDISQARIGGLRTREEIAGFSTVAPSPAGWCERQSESVNRKQKE